MMKEITLVLFMITMNLTYSGISFAKDSSMSKPTDSSIFNQDNWSFKISDNRQIIQVNGMFGLSDIEGKELCPANYDRIFPFNGENAIVCNENLYGILDINGNELIKPEYDHLTDFENGFSVGYMRNTGMFLINESGERVDIGEGYTIIKGENNYLLKTGRKYRLINTRGDIVYEFEIGQELNDTPELFWVEELEKLRTCKVHEDKAYREQKIDNRNFQKCRSSANLPFQFRENLAIVPVMVEGHLKYCYIDSNGVEKFSFTFDEAHSFVGSLACVRVGTEWGIIDKKGDWVLQPTFHSLINANGELFVYTENEKQGIIDINGNVILPASFSSLSHVFDDLFSGLPYPSQGISNYDNGNYYDATSAHWGVLNVRTKDTILPFLYDEVIVSGEGIGNARKFKYWQDTAERSNVNFIRSQILGGSYISEFEGVIFSTEGILGNYQTDAFYWNDRIYPPSLEEFQKLFLGRWCEDVFFMAGKYFSKKDGKITNIDRVNAIQEKMNGLRLVEVESSDSKWGVKDLDGNLVLPFEFDSVLVGNTCIIVKKNDKFGAYDFNGDEMISIQYGELKELETGVFFAKQIDEGKMQFLNRQETELKR